MTTKKTMLKKMLIQLTIVCTIILSSPQVKAQGEVAAGASAVKGLYTAAKWTHDNWTIIKWVVMGHMEHRWWACIYQDGFVTYNSFRSYRTSMNAYKYFVKGEGDCDAIYGRQGAHICYENPMQAKRYSDQHGDVVDIQYQDDSGRYHSVFEY